MAGASNLAFTKSSAGRLRTSNSELSIPLCARRAPTRLASFAVRDVLEGLPVMMSVFVMARFSVVDRAGAAAADRNGVAVDGYALRRSQESDHPRDLFGVHDAADTHVRAQVLRGLLRGALGAGRARVHRGHVDALRAELVRQILGDGGDSDVPQSRYRATGAVNGETTDVDDATPALGNEVRSESTRGAQIADDLDVEVFQHLLVHDLLELGRR